MLLTVDLERLDIQPGHRLLDAGCGEGRHCFGSIYRGATVVGLDLDFDSMREASKNLRARGEELGHMGAMLQGDAFHLPFADASFDRIICSEVMEHASFSTAKSARPRRSRATRTGTTRSPPRPKGERRVIADSSPNTSNVSAGSLGSGRRKLRIAFVAYRGNMNSGGQGIYLRHLGLALTEAGHTVEVISGPPYPELDPRI